jgi:uncharacterized protein YndB with AHSA1/START domain
MKISDKPIQVTQSFNKSSETVWAAITDHQQMIQWYFATIPDFKAVVGFETRFTIENEGRHFIHRWKVIEVKQNHKLVYNWKYENYKGDSNIEFILSSKNKITTLTVKCIILEDFQEGIPEFNIQSCLAGWKYFIQHSLKNYLESK